MTKKHFIEMAKIIKMNQDLIARKQTADDFAKMAIQANPRFNKETFFKACGI
jgi:hypothetical protein